MALRVMTVREAIRALAREYPGQFSAELGIDLSEGRSREVFRWLIASVLFGAGPGGGSCGPGAMAMTGTRSSISPRHQASMRGLHSSQSGLNSGVTGRSSPFGQPQGRVV